MQLVFNMIAGGAVGWCFGMWIAWRGTAKRYQAQVIMLRQQLVEQEDIILELKEKAGK